MGADFVFIGKYWLLASAAHGASGIEALAELLKKEVETAMRLTGQLGV